MNRQARSDSKDSASIPDPSKAGHRSGQEYEYGETPQTGLGGGGTGADPSKQNARHAEPSPADMARETPAGNTQQVGGSAEAAGFARDRESNAQMDEDADAAKGGRSSQNDDQRTEQTDVRGSHGITKENAFDR